MMTWVTRISLFDSAEDLELNQLALAQRESESLFNELVFGEADPEHGDAPAPLKMMWQGYEGALAGYSVACAAVLVGHGITNGVRSLEIANTIKDLRQGGDPVPFDMPPWLQDIDVLMSHRSNLMRRWPDSYSFPRNPKDMPYLWPIVDDDGGYILKLSKYDRELLAKGERSLPKKVMERIAE
jgi:hypothetical protein